MDYISNENTVYMQRLCCRLCLDPNCSQVMYTALDIESARHYPRLTLKLMCGTSASECCQLQRVVVLYGIILDAASAHPSHTNDLECIQNINHQPILDHFRL